LPRGLKRSIKRGSARLGLVHPAMAWIRRCWLMPGGDLRPTLAVALVVYA